MADARSSHRVPSQSIGKLLTIEKVTTHADSRRLWILGGITIKIHHILTSTDVTYPFDLWFLKQHWHTFSASSVDPSSGLWRVDFRWESRVGRRVEMGWKGQAGGFIYILGVYTCILRYPNRYIIIRTYLYIYILYIQYTICNRS